MKIVCLALVIAYMAQGTSAALVMPGKDVKILGCYNDNVFNRAIWGDMTTYAPEEVVKKCYERAKSIGATIFGVQFNTQCFTGKDAHETYNKFGRPPFNLGCLNGRGGTSLNDIYQISYHAMYKWKKSAGFCVNCEGRSDGVGIADEFAPNAASCLGICEKNPKATACQYHSNRWCTVFTAKEVARGDGTKISECWAIDTCKAHPPVEHTPAVAEVDPIPPTQPPIRPVTDVMRTHPPIRTIKHIDHFTRRPIRPVTDVMVSHPPIRTIKHIDHFTRRPTERPSTRRPVTVFDTTRRPRTRRPTTRPTRRPTTRPTRRPTRRPTTRPTRRPTRRPTTRPTRRPTRGTTERPNMWSNGMWSNAKCPSVERVQTKGCFNTRGREDERDERRGKLLVYRRHNIDWNNIAQFASNLACACAEAAQDAGAEYFGLHFWGECWALKRSDIIRAHDGDCTRANGKFNRKCNGKWNFSWGQECLGDKSYFVYKLLGPNEKPEPVMMA